MGSLVLNVLGTEMHLEVHFQKDALVFLSLVQLMNGSERRHTHVANTKEYNVYKICLARFMKKTFPKSISHMTHYVLLHVSNVDNVT